MGTAQAQPDGVLDFLNKSLVFWEITTLAVMVVVIVVLAVMVWRVVSRRRPTAAIPAHSILDERYARGEIDRDEYEQKRRDLRR